MAKKVDRRKLQPALKSAKKGLKDNKKRHRSVTLMSFVSDKGKVENCANTACHAGLRSGSHGGIQMKNPEYIVSHIQEPNQHTIFNSNDKKEESLHLFLEWLTNFSPYRHTFQSKSASKIIKDGSLVSYTDKPSNLVAGGLIASRLWSEFPNHFNVWKNLVDNGCCPNTAFMMAHYFSQTKARINRNNLSGHAALNGQYVNYQSSFEAFLNERPFFVGGIYKEERYYNQIHNTWTKPVGKSGIVDGLIKDMKAKAEKVKNDNPFGGAGDIHIITPEEWGKQMSKVIGENYKKLKGVA